MASAAKARFGIQRVPTGITLIANPERLSSTRRTIFQGRMTAAPVASRTVI